MSGYIDLHLHYVPGVDDGVTTLEESLQVCRGLKSLGYGRLVTTPHIREGMFENDRAGLTAAFEQFVAQLGNDPTLPSLGLAAEHHCDGRLLDRIESGGLMPYPGGHALLLELPNEALPVALDRLVFRIASKGYRTVIAHPERCVPLFKRTDPVDKLIDQDVALQLDLMSLVGKYGRAARKAAERMLDEGAYTIAATDTHGIPDLARVEEALKLLHKLVGDDEARLLLAENPRRLLAGEPTL
ncbi:MAG TPA: CpsB/CapC family capsule biosynthesis tyrosine phosphatase [Polyangiales bacterium]|nr:CpsB/CapC family capsule biosynthesis tyrosine phosphatase [Polyangiales bacterium]